jgi:hypothetical protein
MDESRWEDTMRLILKLLAFLIFGPLVLGLVVIAAVAAIVAFPIVWEQAVARFTAPPNVNEGQV